MLKSPNPAVQPNKPRLGQGREGLRREMSIPTQVQSKDENQTREQILSKQREGIQTSLTKPTTVRHIEQRPETRMMAEHTIRPRRLKYKFTFTQIL